MKLARFLHAGTEKWGAIADGKIVNLSAKWEAMPEGLESGLSALAAEAELAAESIDIREVTWLPPVSDRQKILCVGLNYGKHVREAGRELPAYPSIFIRFADSFVGHDEPVIRPMASVHFDFEGELAVIIGRRGRHVAMDRALEYVAGVTCLAENSVRDFQKHGVQVTPGKTFMASGAIGPYVVTLDEFGSIEDLTVRTMLNGAEMQCGSLADLIFPIPQLIAYISTFTELRPGDLIATGTPEGVGSSRTPPVYMKAGDLLEVSIDGVGRLQNRVIDESHR